MKIKDEPYPLEVRLEELIIEINKTVHRFGVFFTTIPKGKGEKMLWLFETFAWLFLTFALILRITGRG